MSLHLVNEVTRLVLHLGVNRSVIVGLCLQSLHLVGGLQTNLKLFPVNIVGSHGTLLDDSQVLSGVSSFFLDHLEVVIAELFPRLSDSDANKWPICNVSYKILPLLWFECNFNPAGQINLIEAVLSI